MNAEEWMECNVLCPICGERFKDTIYTGFLFTPPVVRHAQNTLRKYLVIRGRFSNRGR